MRRKVLAVVLVTTSMLFGGVTVAPDALAAPAPGTLAYGIGQLPVAAEDRTGYTRLAFNYWTDEDRDCQDTRSEVLQAEARAQVSFQPSSRCAALAGRWHSAVDGRTWTRADDVDIDHHVPLAEAWDSGARWWSAARREAFANDLGYAGSLNVITDNVNILKGNRDPANWMPPRAAARCTYVKQWIAVKYRWNLTIDATEKRKLQAVGSGACGKTKLVLPTRITKIAGEPITANKPPSQVQPSGRYFARSGSPWNTPLPADAPIHSASAAYVADLARMKNTSAAGWWINRDEYSSPIYEVTSQTPSVRVTLVDDYDRPFPAQRGDNPAYELAWRLAQGVPIPAGAKAAAGTDQHMTVVNTDSGELWEMWLTREDRPGVTGWSARWGGYLPDHRANVGIYTDPASWGSTGTSLPMAAGMILDSELRAGLIPHALQVTLPDPAAQAVWPAQRSDGDLARLIPEGSILRLKPSVDVNRYTAATPTATATLRTVAHAMQTYGLIVNDRTGSGGPIALRAEPVDQPYNFGDWPNNILNLIPIDHFEFIDVSYRPVTR